MSRQEEMNNTNSRQWGAAPGRTPVGVAEYTKRKEEPRRTKLGGARASTKQEGLRTLATSSSQPQPFDRE